MRCCFRLKAKPTHGARSILRAAFATVALLHSPASSFTSCSQLSCQTPNHRSVPGRRLPSRVVELVPPSSSIKAHYTDVGASLSSDDQVLAIWVALFAGSHIGMSAIRDRLIDICGRFATNANLVGTGLSLPKYWPGDEAGNEIFPDKDSAGRQIYRAGYALISFATLGSALAAYLASTESTTGINLLGSEHDNYFWIAAMSFGAAITSLFNASPLSLMPGFQTRNDGEDIKSPDQFIERDDLLKLEPKGLTRITRHPLILPVVPWGLATSQLAGGRAADVILFGGLAIYAVCGCAAQDLRVVRQEGSVGTVFRPSTTPSGEALQTFFASTSFVPFGAVLDGRQSLSAVVKEVPWPAVVLGCIAGAYMEDFILNWLAGTPTSIK